MIYTSLLEGYARGALSRADAVSLLAATARATARRYGARGSVSLGASGRGALGDEPTYRCRAELVEDLAVVRAAGIDDILLFSLGGVLGRKRPEAWLDALVDTGPAKGISRLTARAAALAGASIGLARGIELGGSIVRRLR